MVKCWRTLPMDVRWVFLDDLLKELGPFKVAGDLAAKAGMSGFIAEGDCGVIRGALDDEAALARYAETGTWSRHQRALFEVCEMRERSRKRAPQRVSRSPET